MSAPLGGTVLFADDDLELRKTLATLLTQLGYEYLAATSGAQAIDAALQHLPDLIILDVLLPDQDGYRICRHIRNTPQLAEVQLFSSPPPIPQKHGSKACKQERMISSPNR